MQPIIELLKPMLEHHKPMIAVFKHRLEVQTRVCNSETYVWRLFVHLASHRGVGRVELVCGRATAINTKINMRTHRSSNTEIPECQSPTAHITLNLGLSSVSD